MGAFTRAAGCTAAQGSLPGRLEKETKPMGHGRGPQTTRSLSRPINTHNASASQPLQRPKPTHAEMFLPSALQDTTQVGSCAPGSLHKASTQFVGDRCNPQRNVKEVGKFGELAMRAGEK